MAKYVVIRAFKDKKTKHVYNLGQEVEMEEARGSEVGTHYLRRLDDPNNFPEEEATPEVAPKAETKTTKAGK